MSSTILKNPLDDFSSYSVHYILLATRTTEDARPFAEEVNNAATLAAIEEVKLLGEAIPYGDKDTAFLVMDTRRFSQFTISDLKYEVLINGIEQAQSHGNLATKIDMTILDSVGISFINFLQYLMNEKMQCNFDGIVYMLRLVFVGHHPDGTTETVQTVTIPMNLTKLEVNLDFAKGVYTAEFMPNINFDAVANGRWLNIGAASSFFSSVGNNKLGGVIDGFERRLNDASLKYYKDATMKLQEAGRQVNSKGQFGRQVQYMITIPKEWRDFEFTGAATANATETEYTKDTNGASGKAGKPVDSHMAVTPGMQIPAALDLIFKQVKEIADLGNGRKSKEQGGSVSFYKHFTSITSDDTTIVVHVDVVPFVVPNVLTDQSNKTVSQGEADFYQEVDGKRVPRNYAEFDYIFTGKNKDVLNFDMKLQDLSFMLASNLELGADAMQNIINAGQAGTASTEAKPIPEIVSARAFDPLLMPQNTGAELENLSRYSSLIQKSNPNIGKASQDYTRNLSRFYAAAPITAVMTIRGNPDIMTKFNASSFVPHMLAVSNTGSTGGASTSNDTVKTTYRDKFEKEILNNNVDQAGNAQISKNADGTFGVKSLGATSYATSPVFVKVNVKGPNVDFRTSETVMGDDFSKEILYDNYYVVFKVTNIIQGSDFTQQLELWSHNVFGQGKLSTPTPRTVS